MEIGYWALVICLAGAWAWSKKNQKHLQIKLAVAEEKSRWLLDLEETVKEKEKEITYLNAELRTLQEKLALSQQAHEQLTETFKVLSSEALERNNRSFLDLARTSLEKYQESAKGDLEKRQQAIGEMMTPVKEHLNKLGHGLEQLEKERKVDQETLKQQVYLLNETEKQLRIETANLVKALRAPATRGRWGEIQLRRVVELAGMLNYCDFYEQKLATNEDDRLRPDLVVRLPGGRQVIVDAKAPLEAYLEAIEVQDEKIKIEKLKDHARQVRNHLMLLGKKAYWEHFQPTPEFVVLFLPSETFFSAALEFDPSLIEVGAEERVILATPTTLIALLRSVVYGWKQENLSRHAQQVEELGQELYKRIVDMSNHWMKMGRNLSGAVDSYNKAVGSLETRVLVTARRFKDLGAASSYIESEEIEVVEKVPRHLQATEMVDASGNETLEFLEK